MSIVSLHSEYMVQSVVYSAFLVAARIVTQRPQTDCICVCCRVLRRVIVPNMSVRAKRKEIANNEKI